MTWHLRCATTLTCALALLACESEPPTAAKDAGSAGQEDVVSAPDSGTSAGKGEADAGSAEDVQKAEDSGKPRDPGSAADAGKTADKDAGAAGANDTAPSTSKDAGSATSADAAGGDTATSQDTAGTGTIPANQAKAGMQYNGSVAVLLDTKAGKRFVGISAPILPSTKVLYQYEKANYPTTQAKKEAVAKEAGLTFDFLLNQCAKDYPKITLSAPGSGAGPTNQQLKDNYSAVAECSYKQYVAKPYWIPALVEDVDICALKLGPDWRTLEEGDIKQLTQADVKWMQDVLTGNGFWGGFYFSLKLYVQMASGKLEFAELGWPVKWLTWADIKKTPYGGNAGWHNHLEGGWVLRCLRSRVVAPVQ